MQMFILFILIKGRKKKKRVAQNKTLLYRRNHVNSGNGDSFIEIYAKLSLMN